MAKVREFFDSVQMAAESGGKQFDKDGKPLVGRYRDGSTPAPNKRAYGAGQMQVGTARNTATKHGIRWDPDRFMKDKQYNLDLADAHMKDLVGKYGDRTLARAAYHQGEPTVDKAIAKFGRAGFAQGLGPEGRKYIQMGSGKGVGNTSSPGQGVADPAAFLAALESDLAPESQASGGVTSNAGAIFGSDKEMGARADTVEGTLVQQGAQLDVLTQVQDAAQAVQLQSMAEQVDDSRAISNEIVSGTEALKRQVMPVFQARGRVADQLDKLNTMNPLERGIRGIFDLNYDKKFLEGQLSNFDRTLEARANDYDYINKLHGVALQEIERRYSLDNAMPGLLVKQTEEDLGITGMRIQQAAGMLGSLRDKVSSQTQLISAKAMAREDMMNRIDNPTALTLANEAKQNNGVVKFNGIEFSYGELRDRLEKDEDQELNRKAHRMAMANNQMDMAEKFAINIARSLTRPQAEAALANGGVHNGIQLPQDVLANVYQSQVNVAKTQAEAVSSTLPSTIAMRVATDELNRITAIQSRTASMFGGAGIPNAATFLQTGADTIRELVRATEQGAPPEVITALTQKIAANSKGLEDRLDTELIRQAGGDKKSAAYVKGFVMGSKLNSGASIEAITHFAIKGSAPEGIAMSPEATAVFKRAQKLTQEIRAADPKISQASLQQRVAMGLSEYAAKSVGQSRLELVTKDLPTLAKAANHPFAKVPPQAWSRARANATNEAYAVVARQIDSNVDEVRRMRATGKPLDSSPEGKAKYDAFKKNIAVFNATEQSALIREMDEIDPIQPGRRNSSIMIDFLRSPKLTEIAGQYQQATGANSFGDYIVNPMSEGALESMLASEGNGLADAQAEVTRSTRQSARTVASGYGADPFKRSMVILGGVEGVGPEGAKRLAPFLQQVIQQQGINPSDYELGDTGNSMMVRHETAILNALQSTKFEDPAMEAYRKTAIRGWSNVATQADGFFGTMVKMIGGEY